MMASRRPPMMTGRPSATKAGSARLRESGIDAVGKVPWGTHFCQFYQGSQDLVDVLVPYFKSGLQGNEFCMWVTSAPLEVEEATAALREALPDLDAYIQRGQIEILDYKDWYIRSGKFNSKEVLAGWVSKLEEARVRGFEGLRLTGNTHWLEDSTWNDFEQYEAAVNAVIGNHRMIAMCSYALEKCGAREIIDVVANHQFALIKKSGCWEIMESRQRRRVEEELQRQTKRTACREYTLLKTIPGIGESLGLTILYEIGDIDRFPTVKDFLSYCRLVKGTVASAGKIKGLRGAKLGNPYLRWAFGEAAVIAKRDHYRLKPLAQGLEARMNGNKFKANTVIAIKLARAAYFMLKNKTVFDPERLTAVLAKAA